MFVKAYVIYGGNLSRAYADSRPNVTLESAGTLGSRLFKKVEIKQAIAEEYKRIWRDRDTEIEKSRSYELLNYFVEADIANIIDVRDGTISIKDFNELPSSVTRCIESIEKVVKETETGSEERIKIKMVSRLEALKLKMKIQDMLESEDESVPTVIKIIPAKRPERRPDRQLPNPRESDAEFTTVEDETKKDEEDKRE